MQVQRISNNTYNTNFGITYVRPKSWPPEVLDKLMHSNLVKEIDCKYPYAKVRYIGPSKFRRDETLFKCGQSEEGYLYFVLNKQVKPLMDSMSSKMVDFIDMMSLDKLEGDILRNLEKKQKINNIYEAAKESNKKERLSLIEHIKSLFM